MISPPITCFYSHLLENLNLFLRVVNNLQFRLTRCLNITRLDNKTRIIRQNLISTKMDNITNLDLFDTSEKGTSSGLGIFAFAIQQ